VSIFDEQGTREYKVADLEKAAAGGPESLYLVALRRKGSEEVRRFVVAAADGAEAARNALAALPGPAADVVRTEAMGPGRMVKAVLPAKDLLRALGGRVAPIAD